MRLYTVCPQAFRQACALFDDSELTWPARGPDAMLPPLGAGVGVLEGLAAEGEGPRVTQTVGLVRPEARAQVHRVLKYARRAGLALVALRMSALTPDAAAALCGGAGASGCAGLVRRASIGLLLRREGAHERVELNRVELPLLSILSGEHRAAEGRCA
jgi:hypothetical protein